LSVGRTGGWVEWVSGLHGRAGGLVSGHERDW